MSGRKTSSGEKLKSALTDYNYSFCISDTMQPDCPIVYSSDGFFELTGYPREEIVGP